MAEKYSSRKGRVESNLFCNTKPNLHLQKSLKSVRGWFALWRPWQKRIAICHMLEQCPYSQLEWLSTALEPVLHLDFASSLAPLNAALHQEGSQTFFVKRALSENPLRDNLDYNEESVHHTIDNSEPYKLEEEKTARENDPPIVFQPTMHLSHTQHHTSSQIQSREELFTTQRQLNSIPNIRSTTDLLQKTRSEEDTRGKFTCRKSKSLSQLRNFKHKNRQKLAEEYKKQLNSIIMFAKKSNTSDNMYLLFEVIKLCDKDLLSYLVQCLYQRLHQNLGIQSLTNVLLLKVFSYLDPKSLCQCSAVCHQWHQLSSLEELWIRQCHRLGVKEKLGDIVNAIQAVHLSDGMVEQSVDWKQAYKELYKLSGKIKMVFMQSIIAANKKKETIAPQVRNLTSARIRLSLNLRDMLELVKASGAMPLKSTTHDVINSAPVSAATQRRIRREMIATAKKLEDMSVEVNSHTSTVAIERNEKEEAKESSEEADQSTSAAVPMREMPVAVTASPLCGLAVNVPPLRGFAVTVPPLHDAAIDSRPGVPSLPNPDGIDCLILAGYLSSGERPSPGKPEPIPVLRRIQNLGSTVLCLQCDQRKIIAGMADRMIRVFDMRSGRLVSILEGHKGSVQCLQFDDHRIVSGSWDTTCIVWDVVQFTAVRTLMGHTNCVSCLHLHKQTLVTGSHDRSLRLWDMITWGCIMAIPQAHDKPITCVSLNGKLLASGSADKTVKLWSLSGYTCISVLTHQSRLTCLCLSKLCLVTATGDGAIILWGVQHSATSPVRQAATSLMMWEPDYRTPLGFITAMSIDRGKVFAAGSDDVVQEWDIATGACTRTLRVHSAPTTAIWAGNRCIVTAAEDKTICVWLTKKAYTTERDSNEDSFYTELPTRVITTT